MEKAYWRKCGSCKTDIGFNTIYQSCSVSTCSKMVFCSVECWDMHNPIMNHKSAWAEENTSPAFSDHSNPSGPTRRIIINPTKPSQTLNDNEKDTLVVVSKLKQYIKDKHDMNTSASVIDLLSNQIRRICDQASDKARRDGRKTLMDRDF